MFRYQMALNGDMGIILEGNSQGQLSVSGTAAQTSAFASGGYYDLWCDVDVYIKVAATANDVTTSTGYLLRANNTLALVMIGKNSKLGGVALSSGTLRYHKVS